VHVRSFSKLESPGRITSLHVKELEVGLLFHSCLLSAIFGWKEFLCCWPCLGVVERAPLAELGALHVESCSSFGSCCFGRGASVWRAAVAAWTALGAAAWWKERREVLLSAAWRSCPAGCIA
jgi:hypothetical protein